MFLHLHASCLSCDLCTDPLWILLQQPLCMTVPPVIARNSLLEQHLDLIHLMSTIFLSMAHHIYKPNYLKFPFSDSFSKEGRLTHIHSSDFTLSLIKTKGIKMAFHHAFAFSDHGFHSCEPTALSKRNIFPETTVFFSCSDMCLVIWHINGIGGV